MSHISYYSPSHECQPLWSQTTFFFFFCWSSFCMCMICSYMWLCLSLRKNNYKCQALLLWSSLSGLPPWVHGSSRLITCLMVMMSSFWLFFLGLWTQDFLGWAGLGQSSLGCSGHLKFFFSFCLILTNMFSQKGIWWLLNCRNIKQTTVK